jgi:hypothetical protein
MLVQSLMVDAPGSLALRPAFWGDGFGSAVRVRLICPAGFGGVRLIFLDTGEVFFRVYHLQFMPRG